MLFEKYRTTDPVIATYDFNDIASGTGYITFYIYRDEAGGSHLSTTANYGTSTGTHRHIVADGEKNYDSSAFKVPRIIKGDVIIDLAHNTNTSLLTFVLYRVRNGAEMQIGTYAFTQAGGGLDDITTISFNAPETVLAIGDILRLSLTISGGSGYVDIDPTNHETNGITKIYIPFKVDV